MNGPNWYSRFGTSFCLIGLWMYYYSYNFRISVLIGMSRALAGSYFVMIVIYCSSRSVYSSGISNGISLSTSYNGLSCTLLPTIPLLLINSFHLVLSDVYYMNHSNNSHLFALSSISFHIDFQSVSYSQSFTLRTF